MSFFSRAFSSTPAAPAPAQTTTPEKAPNGNESLSSTNKPNPTPDGNIKNPLDVYKELYENANKDSGIQAPSFKLDSKVLHEVSSSMDFTKGIQEDLMAKALEGDAKSLLAVIQQVGRNAYSASLEHATALTETHLAQRGEYEAQRLNEGVRAKLTEQALASTPNYSHPVLKAELNRIASMIAKQNPDASPQDIARRAQEHLQNLSKAMNGEEATNKESSGEMDWTKYLTS